MKNTTLLTFATLLAISSTKAYAIAHSGTRLGVSQGISAPTGTTPINFNHGFLQSNAAAAANFGKAHISLEGDTGGGNTNFGGELGLGSGMAGVGLGYFKADCENCEGGFGAMGGLASSAIAGGIGYHEKSVYSAGAIFNPRGAHRVGLAFDYHGSNSGISAFGAGYSYHGQNVVFALDASRRGARSKTLGDGAILVTPGLAVSSGMLSASISYDLYLNENLSDYANQVWFGLGLGNDRLQAALYYKYQNKWSVGLTAWL